MEAIDAVKTTAWEPSAAMSADPAALLADQTSASVQPGGSLGKNEFLNLLVTQLSSQDPLDPMDSTASIAQLAQFSALEQMQNVNTQLESQRHSSGLVDAMLLQDQTVEAQLSNGSTVQGTVERMTWMNGEMVLQMNGESIPMSSLIGLRLTAATPPPDTPVTPTAESTSSDSEESIEAIAD